MLNEGGRATPQTTCYRAYELMRDRQFEDAERLLAHALTKTEDPIASALFHSSLGVLEKMRGEFKVALRHYRRAEKLLPEDPALKLITARLLIEVYHEYDQAIRKCQAVRELAPDHVVIVHQAYTLEGVAAAGQGKRRTALAALEASSVGGFRRFLTCKNINFELVQCCVQKGWAPESCQHFLNEALVLARECQEPSWELLIQRIINSLAG